MKNYFNLKDKTKRELRLLLVYSFNCNNYNAEYIGKNKRHYRTRTSEHIGVSPLARKCVKNNFENSAVHDHILFCKTVVLPEDFSIPLLHYYFNLRSSIISCLFSGDIHLSLGISLSFSELFCCEFFEPFAILVTILLPIKLPVASAVL